MSAAAAERLQDENDLLIAVEEIFGTALDPRQDLHDSGCQRNRLPNAAAQRQSRIIALCVCVCVRAMPVKFRV